MSEDGNYGASVTGTVQAIHMSKRGVELILDVENPQSANSNKDSNVTTCRLDRSVVYLDSMLQLAKTALLHNLQITLFGFGDDRDDTLEFDEIRLLTRPLSHGERS